MTVRRKSLLPAGITGVEGAFAAGDPVDLCDTGRSVIARGLVNYDVGGAAAAARALDARPGP